MANKKIFELALLKTLELEYKKPEKKNKLVDEKKYLKVDKTCENQVKVANTGVVYVEKEALSSLMKVDNADAEYIYDNKIKEEDKKNFGNKDYAHSSAVVGELDRRAQESRNSEIQAINQYSRDSLTNISDSDQVNKLRRDFDGLVDKTLPKLRKMRDSEVDEITGETLKDSYAFHHNNKKSIHTTPEDTIDPDKGSLVNPDTHKEIHRRKINNSKELEKQKEDIKNTIVSKEQSK